METSGRERSESQHAHERDGYGFRVDGTGGLREIVKRDADYVTPAVIINYHRR